MGQWSGGSEDQGVISNNPAVKIRNKNCFVSTVTVSNIILAMESYYSTRMVHI